MGRIEDAVKKLQQAASPSATRSLPKPAPPRLGTIVARTSEYEGKQIEVDFEQLRLNELLAPDSDERRLEEQYRAIKRPLLRNADALRSPRLERGNLIMVASALSGEGKTFTCVNLCLSIAREKDWAVVLVDADCSKPHLTRLFSAEGEPGLLDLLRDSDSDFDSYVMATDIPGFSLMPSGTAGGDSSELLASRRMDEICASLSSDRANRIIVFDSAPLLLASESAALSAHVGQVAFVVRANETPQPAVLAALEKLDHEKAIGCILNRTYGLGFAGTDGYGYEAYGTYNT